MSRGHGRIERELLSIISCTGDKPATLADLTEDIFGRRALSRPTRSETETVRRALKTLARERYIDLWYGTADTAGSDTRRRQLVVTAGEKFYR